MLRLVRGQIGDIPGCPATIAHHLVQLPDGQWLVGGNAYEDEYRRADGRWRIARRRVVRPFDIGPFSTLLRADDESDPDRDLDVDPDVDRDEGDEAH